MAEPPRRPNPSSSDEEAGEDDADQLYVQLSRSSLSETFYQTLTTIRDDFQRGRARFEAQRAALAQTQCGEMAAYWEKREADEFLQEDNGEEEVSESLEDLTSRHLQSLEALEAESASFEKRLRVDAAARWRRLARLLEAGSLEIPSKPEKSNKPISSYAHQDSVLSSLPDLVASVTLRTVAESDPTILGRFLLGGLPATSPTDAEPKSKADMVWGAGLVTLFSSSLNVLLGLQKRVSFRLVLAHTARVAPGQDLYRAGFDAWQRHADSWLGNEERCALALPSKLAAPEHNWTPLGPVQARVGSCEVEFRSDLVGAHATVRAAAASSGIGDRVKHEIRSVLRACDETGVIDRVAFVLEDWSVSSEHLLRGIRDALHDLAVRRWERGGKLLRVGLFSRRQDGEWIPSTLEQAQSIFTQIT